MATDGEMVTVICRLPSGLILDLYDDAEIRARGISKVPVVGAPQPRATVRLAGARSDPRFHIRNNVLIGMGGRTPVAKDFWEAWIKQNPNDMHVAGKVIFAEPTEARAISALAEVGQHRTGFEGCDQAGVMGAAKLDKDD